MWKLRISPQPLPLDGMIDDARRQPRFKLAVPICIKSRAGGMLMGRTVDTSESGIAALLTIEVPVGEFVELRIQAIVRQKDAFCYGC